jgi:hypothetical protein
MPPGYTAFFMWAAFTILWWSGWRKETADGIPDAAAAVFLAGWPAIGWRTLPAGDSVLIQGAYMWTMLAMIWLFWRMEPPLRVMAVSAGFLASSLGVWLTYSFLLYVTPDWAMTRIASAAVGVCAALLVRGAAGQIAAISLAVLIPEFLEAIWMTESGPLRIGSPQMMENWWIGVLAARVCAVSAAAIRAGVVRFVWRKEGS